MKENFWKSEVFAGKTPFFVIDPCTSHSIYLNIGFSNSAVLYANVAFSILIILTKKWQSSFC